MLQAVSIAEDADLAVLQCLGEEQNRASGSATNGITVTYVLVTAITVEYRRSAREEGDLRVV
ncbi:hypothetical protein AURDEDRAFT_111875 [Auricularia subglabra TFB-10046 SS5]|nr:hypothetical protein AURDEDRAFT_111875 [Auricularia subglabra TFB-10046 SS5]